ncbi:CRISPR-associated helicase Cas3' [Alloalcanivorax marinus]|uniref:CRISPR-associated helicase Cas3' n=1 Tax=Alloalcanivorax marinus TaxID=1177169 RepID=UPI0021D22E34|nr:CRISPR-associated helicase Cas3' [Alloalcanivorax marinus]
MIGIHATDWPSCFLYWGKARPASAEGAAYHLLPFHSLDVAAVGWHLLAPERPLALLLARRLDLPPTVLRSLLVFFLGLHDLGKFARAFQGLVSMGALVPPLASCRYTERHDRLGAVLWSEAGIPWLRDGTLGFPKQSFNGDQRNTLSTVLGVLTSVVFGHHGKPVARNGLRMQSFFGADQHADDHRAASAFVAEWAALMAVPWPVEQLTSPQWAASLRGLSWTLAGWAVLSDWLGSNQTYFEYVDEPEPLKAYWPVALEKADQALSATGFGHTLEPRPYTGLSDWFNGKAVTPTPLQGAVEALELQAGPQLFILEDVTGAGKTEAACILAQRLLYAGEAEGLYFALPTMATSNAMYSRLGAMHRRFYTEEGEPSFVLAHGARDLNEDFARSLVGDQPGDRNYQAGEASASAQCNHWLADSRKKALLADVAVGTIDQALMGVLPFRHQSLRLYGLARKVLIVDEVHAYDVYTRSLLGALLAHHARQGGSAILLTATLPLGQRQALVNGWRQALNAAPISLQETEFPLLTRTGGDPSVLEQPVEARPASRRSVAVDWLEHEDQAVEAVINAVSEGRSVAWVRNTVDDAIRAYQTVRERHPEPDRCVLFHSRFAMVDRQEIESRVLSALGKESEPAARRGQVLIATQVFQESLDCDVDVMISDLAPVDLLIQRAGRLQRHARGERPPPRLWLLAPPWNERPGVSWLRDALLGTSFVYPDVAISWLTQKVLRERGGIHLPKDARVLLEGVYGVSEQALPEGLQASHLQQEGEDQGRVAMARYNLLDLAAGYVGDDQPWLDDHQEIGTRLSDEPTVNVVLLKRDAEGGIALWAQGEQHAAMLSQLRLRESQARKLPELAGPDLAAWEELQGRYKALKYTQPWLPEADAAVRYDPALGCVLG